MGKLVFLLLRAEAQFVHQLQGVAQRIAALEAVLYLAEDFADLVFDGVRAGGALAEALEVGEELAVHILDQVVAGQRVVMVENEPSGFLGAAHLDQLWGASMMRV
jgi:hypothetical protein